MTHGKKTRLGLQLLFLLLGVSQMSCVRIAERLATDLADRSVRHNHLFQLIEGDLARYRHCLKSSGGICQVGSVPGSQGAGATQFSSSSALEHSVQSLHEDHPARNAAGALRSPILGCAAVLHDHVAGNAVNATPDCYVTSEGKDSTVHIKVSMTDGQKLIDDVHRATASGGWDAYEQHARDHLSRLTPGTPQHERVRKDHHRLLFIREYMKAYFRNGRFLSVAFQVDRAKGIADVQSQLEKHSTLACQAFNAAKSASDPTATQTPEAGAAPVDCQPLATEIYGGLLGSGKLGQGLPIQLISVSDTGFRPRDGGVTDQFPQIDVNLDPLASPVVNFNPTFASAGINFTSIGSDLIRVLIQAVFDSRERLPAVSGATGLTFPTPDKAYELSPFQPVEAGKPGVDTEDFNEMRRINQGAGAAAGVIIDRVIRGIGPLSLNNEALAQMITNVVATTVQKAMEKATWCFYACDINVDLEKARADLGESIEAGVQRLEGRLAGYAHGATERVRLAFSTSK